MASLTSGEPAMPRAARLYYPGGIFHIVSPCLNREYLLDGGDERAYYVGLLGRVLARTDHRVLAWCLMSNHVHLVVEAGNDPLARLMKPLHVGYATWKNQRDGRLGPVFAERYRSLLVERESHLDEVVRYVHLNPVRAGVVTTPEASTWTSHRAYLGQAPLPAWLHTAPLLERFSRDPVVARERYACFVLEGVGGAREPTWSGEGHRAFAGAARPAIGDANRVSHPILGSEGFAEEVLAKQKQPRGLYRPGKGDDWAGRRPTYDQLVSTICTLLDLDLETFRLHPRSKKPAAARHLLMWFWVHVFGAPQSEICRVLRVDSGVVARWYGKAVARREQLEPWLERVADLLPDAMPKGARSEGEMSASEEDRRRRATYAMEVRED